MIYDFYFKVWSHWNLRKQNLHNIDQYRWIQSIEASTHELLIPDHLFVCLDATVEIASFDMHKAQRNDLRCMAGCPQQLLALSRLNTTVQPWWKWLDFCKICLACLGPHCPSIASSTCDKSTSNVVTSNIFQDKLGFRLQGGHRNDKYYCRLPLLWSTNHPVLKGNLGQCAFETCLFVGFLGDYLQRPSSMSASSVVTWNSH